MRVADTSALYAVLVPEDAHHGRTRVDLADVRHLLIPAEVMAELAGILARRLGADAARQAIRALRRHPQMEVQPTWDEPWDNILDRAAALFEDGVDPSYVDCVVIAWCKKRGLRPWTYDQRILAACA